MTQQVSGSPAQLCIPEPYSSLWVAAQAHSSPSCLPPGALGLQRPVPGEAHPEASTPPAGPLRGYSWRFWAGLPTSKCQGPAPDGGLGT